MNQENKDPSLGEQARETIAADRSSQDTSNVAEKKVDVKKFCPMPRRSNPNSSWLASINQPCIGEECAWWIEGKCAIVKIVDVLNNLFVVIR